MGYKEVRQQIVRKQQEFVAARGRVGDKIHQTHQNYLAARQKLKERLIGVSPRQIERDSLYKESGVLPAGTKMDIEVFVAETTEQGVITRPYHVRGVRLQREQQVKATSTPSERRSPEFKPYSLEKEGAEEEVRTAVNNYQQYLEARGADGLEDYTFEEGELAQEINGKKLIVAATDEAIVQDFMGKIAPKKLPFDPNHVRTVDILNVRRIWPHSKRAVEQKTVSKSKDEQGKPGPGTPHREDPLEPQKSPSNRDQNLQQQTEEARKEALLAEMNEMRNLPRSAWTEAYMARYNELWQQFKDMTHPSTEEIRFGFGAGETDKTTTPEEHAEPNENQSGVVFNIDGDTQPLEMGDYEQDDPWDDEPDHGLDR